MCCAGLSLKAAQASPNSFFPPKSVSKAAHLAMAPAQGPGLPLGPRLLLKGNTVHLGLPGPHHPRLNDPKGLHHKEHYSLLIRLPLETGISMQKAYLLPDQTGERCHPLTPTDCLRREFVTRSGLRPLTDPQHISLLEELMETVEKSHAFYQTEVSPSSPLPTLHPSWNPNVLGE